MAIQVFFEIGDAQRAVVKNGRCQRRVGFSIGQHAQEIIWLAGASGGNYGNMGGPRNGACQLAVEALLDAIGIHGGQQNFAGAEFFAACRPCYDVDIFVVAAAACVDVPGSGRAASRVNGQHHCLRAEFQAQLGDQRRGSRTAAVLTETLSAPTGQDAARIGNRTNAASHCQRDKNFARGSGDHVRHDLARVA